MAMKVALAAALLVGLVALASATTITTTVTTTSYDREGSQRYQQCSQQVEGREFRACQNYLTQRRSRNADEAEEEAVIENISGRKQQGEQLLEQCCEQLKEVDRNECGCEAIKQAVKQAQQQQGSHSSRRHRTGRSQSQSQSEQIYEKARELPQKCQLREEQCSLNLVFV